MDLTQLIFSAPERALGLIRRALARQLFPKARLSQARLVIAVDQMEELFTTEAEPTSREALVRAWICLPVAASFG